MSLQKLFFLSFILLLVHSGNSQVAETAVSEISKITFTYSDTLKLDYYKPENVEIKNAPLILLVHGGGFSVGARDNKREVAFSFSMVEKGFHVASISYDLTMKGRSFSCDCPSEDKLNTFLQSSRNIISALEFLKELQPELGYDSQKIILAGSSAGAEAVLNTAFMLQSKEYETSKLNTPEIAGVISLAGALIDKNLITSANAVPVYLVHGIDDKVVPYATAPHHFCNPGAVGYLMLDGSKTIAGKLKSLGVAYKLVSAPGGGHEWANLGYDQTEEMVQFIETAIINQKMIQEEIVLNTK